MPTINQLVHNSRKDKVRKSKSPILRVGLNSLKNKQTEITAPQNVEYVLVLEQRLLRNLTQHYVNMHVFV